MRTMKKFSVVLVLVLFAACQASNQNFLGLDNTEPADTTSPTGATTGVATPEEGRSKAIKLKKSFENGEYETAIAELKEDLEDDPDSPVTNYYIAESYRRSNRIQESTDYYAKAIEGGFSDEEMELNYVKALKANENYTEAKRILKDYIEYASVETYKDRAVRELANLEKLDSIQLDVRKIAVSPAVGINTPNAEYSPYHFDGHLYFSSTREEGDLFKGSGQGFSDIYKVKTSGLLPEAGTIETLEDFINSQGVNEGTIAYSPDGNTMVFAKGNSGKKGGRQDVDLFMSTKRNGRWGQPQPMPINSPDYWDSSPAFNQSGTVLYFASNRPGGEGGIDIYRASLNERGRWSNVRSVGDDINTPENEMFPYVSSDNKLYFASDGHPGLGMLDIFEAVNQGGNVTVRNLGPSINSAYDDFGLVYSNFPYEGFFASNRPGGQGDDDIYTFVDNTPSLKVVEYVLKGTTFSLGQDSTKTILGGVRVTLRDDQDRVIDDRTTGRGGTFEFKIDPEKEYTLLGKKVAFLVGRNTLSTVGETVDKSTLTARSFTKEFRADLDLTEILKIRGVDIEVKNVFYDLAKWDIRPDAALELDKLAQFLLDNPAVSIELSSHTDSRDNDENNMVLSQKRAQSAVDYLVTKGIARDRMEPQGYGETRLVNECANDVPCTNEQHQANRRTEFKIIGYDASKDRN